MTVELAFLTATATLCALLFATYGVAQMHHWGIRVSIGNRENPPPLPPWAARAARAHSNLVENLGPFAALVLVSHLALGPNPDTAAGATVFFCARVVHALVYILGIPWVRTIAFFSGLGAEGRILWVLVAGSYSSRMG